MASRTSCSNTFPAVPTPFQGRSALRSVTVRLRLRCFFLVLPEKAVVRLCEAEDSGGPLLGRLMVVGKKCAANLDLTNGFRMAVNAHPRALQAIAYIYVFWVAVSWAGLPAKVFAPQASLHAYGSPPKEPMELLKETCSNGPRVQDSTLALVELHLVSSCPALQPAQVSLNGSAAFWRVGHSSQLCIIGVLAEGGHYSLIKVVDEDVEQDRTQHRPLGNTASHRAAGGLCAADHHPLSSASQPGLNPPYRPLVYPTLSQLC
ncbi:uncharacterized protein LOC121062981 isoform X2 [Cygnus olor]|uniref:uncharacterized protein LOC121062981 isoform X2 n=1 Tax=Cygnus olor TaxID=8869 RepID=UPI001ADEAC76|nr:uncharacterized protein LOC121062981 isoform X2 [Cygnus olor]